MRQANTTRPWPRSTYAKLLQQVSKDGAKVLYRSRDTFGIVEAKEGKKVGDGKLATVQAPALNALNEKLRDDYIQDTLAGVARWNRAVQKCGVSFELRVPHKGFNRKIGSFAGLRIAPDGRVLVTESGIATVDDVQRMRGAGIHAFLVGESFMREADPGAALERLFA